MQVSKTGTALNIAVNNNAQKRRINCHFSGSSQGGIKWFDLDVHSPAKCTDSDPSPSLVSTLGDELRNAGISIQQRSAILSGQYDERIEPNDIAPTLAEMLGIQTPSGSSGRVLTEMLLH